MSKRIKVPDTNIEFTKKSFTGLEYREFRRASTELEFLDEVVEQTIEFGVDRLFIDGKPATDPPMAYGWEDVVLPLYFAVAGVLVPKAPGGTSSETN